MRHHLITLIRTRQIASNIYQQRFHGKRIARESRAGQFVHLLPGSGHLFRRAFSVYATDPAEGTFDVLHQVMGGGTRCLSKLEVGAEIDALGPLGNGFTPPSAGQVPILVGGGLGMAPLRLWALELTTMTAHRKTRPSPVMILGARTKSLTVSPYRIGAIGIRPLWATDDGSRGVRGTAVDLLEKLVLKSSADPSGMAVYGCGPEPMMKALAQSCARHGIVCQVSLERSMPCGFGVCMGCVVTGKDTTGYETHRRVCRDGPVFDAETIEF